MDKQANVQLIDTSDYSNYANGRRYQYFGGRGQADRRDLAGRSAAAARRHRVADKAEMRIGKCLRRRIDQGLAASRFAVVVLSPSYFARGWPQYELDGIVTLSVAGKQNLLPIGTTSATQR